MALQRAELHMGGGVLAAIPRACILGLWLVYWVHLKMLQIIVDHLLSFSELGKGFVEFGSHPGLREYD